MDAPSPEPFMEGTPLLYDQPMMDDFFASLSGDYWGGEEVAPGEADYSEMFQTDPEYAQANAYPGFGDGCVLDALRSRDYAGIEYYQHDFFGDENSLANSSFLASGFGVEQRPVTTFKLPLKDGSGHHLATGSPSAANAFPHPGTTPIRPGQDSMQHRLNVPDAQQLADLSEAQLENIHKDVTQALAVAKQKRLKGSVKSANPERHNTNTEKVDKVGKRSQSKKPLLKCEHPDCDTTFRRNKDRTRHVRDKHQETPGLACPILDCPMGTGHVMTRPDKLRDHLRGKAVFSRTWRCVIPDCFETGESKSWWFDHVAHHDLETRLDNMNSLASYGYKDFYQGYLTRNHLCIRRGCPFGTNSSITMDEHLLIPHEGAHCSCPIPDCKIIYKNWEEVAQHLAAGHTKTARQAVSKVLWDQGFNYNSQTFTCPILACRQIVKDSSSLQISGCDVRKHCIEHGLATLLSAAEPLVNAWRFCFEGYWIGTRPFNFDLNSAKSSSNQIFAYLTFPDAELIEAKTNDDLERLCLEKGINLP